MPTSGHFVTMGFQPSHATCKDISDCKILIFIPIDSPVMVPQPLSSLYLPTPVKINQLMHLLGGHDAKLTVYLYEGFTFGHLVFLYTLKVCEFCFMQIIIFYLLNKTLKLGALYINGLED
jgi:hypothetical protein